MEKERKYARIIDFFIEFLCHNRSRVFFASFFCYSGHELKLVLHCFRLLCLDILLGDRYICMVQVVYIGTGSNEIFFSTFKLTVE